MTDFFTLKHIALGAFGAAILLLSLVVLMPKRGLGLAITSLGGRSLEEVRVATRFSRAFVKRTEGFAAKASTRFDLATLLDTAGWRLRVGEFVLIVFLVSAVCLFGGALISLPFSLICTAIWLGGLVVVARLISQRRRNAFQEQLSGTLMGMAGSLRAGFSLPQVMNSIATDGEKTDPRRVCSHHGRNATGTRPNRCSK